VSFACRSGHASDEPDYCSVCGARIGGATAILATGTSGFCPMCGETREPAPARYCEVCRFDFHEQRPGPPPVAAPPASAAPPAPPLGWELVITVDPALDTDPDPAHPCPAFAAPRVLVIDRAELLVGRDDDPRDIHPEIPLFDPGASRRHAKFVREADGGVAIQDLASTNGSQLNGRDVPVGTRRRLAPGDAVTLGRWTRITLRARR
jgi:hypothetical protein